MFEAISTHRFPILSLYLATLIAAIPATPFAASEHAGNDPEAGSWSALGEGMDGTVSALAVYKGELIAAGNFLNAGGLPIQRIARWDGAQWAPLGAGLNGPVHTLTTHDEYLYAAGLFSHSGTVSTLQVARWDGAEWAGVGGGTNEAALDLTRYEGSLLAAGMLTSAGGQPVEKIALWDGTAWSPLGNPSGDTAFNKAIVVNGDLVVARLRIVNQQLRGSAALWDNGSWIDLGGLANSVVYTVGQYRGDIIAGGNFSEIDGVPVERIAAWNGTTWSALGTGFPHGVAALQSFAGRLAAARGNLGPVAGAQVGLWNGGNWRYWTTDGTGVGRTLAVFNGELVAAGTFTSIDGTPANRIATWRYDELVHANGFD